MKKTTLIISVFLFLFLIVELNAKDPQKIPSAMIKDLKGNSVNTNTFNNNGKPFVINFWATWCKACVLELSSVNDSYSDWQKETGVKIFAVSIDDSRNSKRVAPFVKSRKWTFDVYVDENKDFARAMNVNNPPYSVLCNGNGEIVWQHNGFSPGDEGELIREIRKLSVAK